MGTRTRRRYPSDDLHPSTRCCPFSPSYQKGGRDVIGAPKVDGGEWEWCDKREGDGEDLLRLGFLFFRRVER